MGERSGSKDTRANSPVFGRKIFLDGSRVNDLRSRCNPKFGAVSYNSGPGSASADLGALRDGTTAIIQDLERQKSLTCNAVEENLHS